MREARKHEQENNPHYLKGSAKKREKNGNYENINNIPVAEIDLSVPLKIVGKKRSDKYLIESNENKKSKKKSKKKKHKIVR